MKHFSLIALLALTLGCCGSLSAQQLLRQYIDRDIKSVKAGGQNNLVVRTGDANKVEVVPDGTGGDLARLFSVSNDGTLQVKSGNNSIILTLKPGTLTAVTASDNATMTIDAVAAPRFAATAENLATLTIMKITADSLRLKAENNATLYVNDASLTLLNARATNLSSLTIKRLLADNAFVFADNNATLAIGGGRVKDTLHSLFDNLATIYYPDTLAAVNARESTLPDAVSSANSCRSGREYPKHKMCVRFLRGFHNWGDEPMNGLTGMSGAYSLRTSFSNYQLEIAGGIKFSPHWIAGMAVGWESDCYKFRNDYVALQRTAATGSLVAWDQATLNASDLAHSDLTQWDSRLVARYITIPVTVTYEFARGKMGLSLGVVPGFNIDGKKTGLRHRYSTGDDEYKNTTDMGDYLNPFKCDVRLMLRYGNVGFFVQAPTMPVNRNMGTDLYPFKFGFVI